VACVNGPGSTVLAGPEDILKTIESELPDGTRSAFIPGNTAFHSSATEPVLPAIRSRLARLEAPPASASFSVPLISTVTGKLHHGALDGAYWAENVRKPVLFKDAILALFSGQGFSAPDVVSMGHELA
jgi:acyl transferase domain-containing protein